MSDENFDLGFQKIEVDMARFDKQPPLNNLPILPTRNLVLFPFQTITFELGRETSYETASLANERSEPIGVVCQTNPEENTPAVTTGLYKYGVFADVLAVFERPDGVRCALVRARGRFRIMGKGKPEESAYPGLHARVKELSDIVPEDKLEYKYALDELKKASREAFRDAQTPLQQALAGISDPVELINFLCTNGPFETAEKASMLSKSSLYDRCLDLLTQISILKERLKITEQIARKAKSSLEENQRNAFLQQQMEAIRETLYGDESDEADQLLEKGRGAGMPKEVLRQFEKDIEKLRRYNPSSPDYSVLYSYLDTLTALPWNKSTELNKDFDAASAILEADHYGLEKVKERIIEQLAVMLNNPNGKSPILCLVGAPGVGKTSIGKSVARALGRKYERVSFGGLHDESEIRGHRRTYIGAMPGRIIDAIKRAGVNNPVLVLDEIDKIGNDYKGDPAAALLEVLDPEQNCHFHDNYIDMDFDLSNVLFIATANTLSTIPRPLLDRMEIIDIPGYLVEEKIEIARRHLLPRICKELNIQESNVNLSDAALLEIIRNYTAESGVRALDKKLAAVARKAILYKMQGKEFPDTIMSEDLYGILGLAPFHPDMYTDNKFAGVVTGLAWTEVGGEILMVESSISQAATPTLTLTGKLGDVMKESAAIAMQWVKANAKSLGINPAVFGKYSIHIHFPEGAIPKDGPSAGITMATSLVSLLLQKRVAPRVAMTGEITLRGKVLPVGGIREKILAAKRAGITTLIMSEDNRRDIDDMPQKYKDGLTFHFVETVSEVIKLAITQEDVIDPIQFDL